VLSSRPEDFDAGLVVALQQPKQLLKEGAAVSPTVARPSGASGDGSGGRSMPLVVVPGARLVVAQAVAGLAAC
jgi:hypothetical protein